jgi:probable phosphoglycerate mutase
MRGVPMKELILVRHGEAEHLVKGITGGWTDLPLTDRGRQQIEVTSKRLKELFGTRIEVMYASDLKRAAESAKIIRKEIDIPLTFDSQLREMNHGLAKDMTWEEAEKIGTPQTEPLRDWIPYPEGESWRMLYERASKIMTELEARDEKTVLIVSHGNMICAIIEWWLQMPEDLSLDFTIHPASITWLGISFWANREIRKLNETAHLSAAGLDDSLKHQ